MSADRVDIADAILAGIGSDDNSLEQMAAIVRNLDAAGYVIVPKGIGSVSGRPPAEWDMQDAKYCGSLMYNDLDKLKDFAAATL